MEIYNNPVSGTGSNLVQSQPTKYFYSLWIKHVSQFLDATGLKNPSTVVEIGPGAALSAGLCALLTGARKYYAFDLLKHSDTQTNLAALAEIVAMLRARTPASNATGFPNYEHVLDEHKFPARFFTEKLLAAALTDERVEEIARAVRGDLSSLTVEYVAPWEDPAVYRKLRGEVDFIFSHSTMEHVEDIERAYAIMGEVCAVDGGMSHQIDFRSHGYSRPWNAYRTFDKKKWGKVTGGSAYSINREPPSRHVDLIEANGFRIVRLIPRGAPNCIAREALAPRFRELPNRDLCCDGLFVQALRNASAIRTESHARSKAWWRRLSDLLRFPHKLASKRHFS